jgi:ABC-type glycerol-3-phosphate transport system substrate-binding protein
MFFACLYLAGCGGSAENTTAQKEFVYVPEYQEVNNGENNAESITVIGDTIYYLGTEYDDKTQKSKSYLYELKLRTEEPVKKPLNLGEDSSISRMSADAEGSLQALVIRYLYEQEGMPKEEVTDAEAAAEDGTSSIAADEDGTVNAAAEGEVGEDGDVAASDTNENTEDGEAVSETESAAIAPVGDYQVPVSQKTEVCKFSVDGTVISSVDVSSVFEDENTYIQYLETDKEGNIYLAYDQGVWVLDKDGKELFTVAVDNWINNMFSTKDGTVMIVYYGQTGMEVYPIDLAKEGLGDAQKNITTSPYSNYVFTKGVQDDLLFSSGNFLYSYNIGDEAPKEILNWVDCDINSNDLISFAMLEDGRVLAVTSYWTDDANTIELAFLTKKKGSEVPEKKIITYSTMFLNYDTRKLVIDFNKKNQEYRVEVKEYMYETEDYEAALTQMKSDIVGGNMPDIIDISGTMQQYASKGLLEDLYPYLDSDPELKRDDYLPNILKAYELDGKLYSISPFFVINTVMAKTSTVGERTSITLDELMNMANELPDNVELYDAGTKSMALIYNIMMNIDQYVDWNTGECKFNGEDFIKTLEFANYFDLEYDYSKEREPIVQRLQSGEVLMVNTYISGMTDYQMYEAMFGEPVSFIGYPTNKDSGSFISGPGASLAMSSKSKNKDGVWQFIRTMITKEAQEQKNGFGFPIMKSALEKRFEDAMTKEYYEDANGNQVEQMKTSSGYEDFSADIYAATQEQVDTVKGLIESVDSLFQYNEQIIAIVDEESAPFFEGQKTAKEVADIIQSRVQIYVNENR